MGCTTEYSFDSIFCFSEDCSNLDEYSDDYEEQLREYQINITPTLFIRHCFFYSDYWELCNQLEVYSLDKFQHCAFEEIQIQLQNILHNLRCLFLPLYQKCLSKHPNEPIQREVALIEMESEKENSPYFAEMLNRLKENNRTEINILRLNEKIEMFLEMNESIPMLQTQSEKTPNFLESRFYLAKGTMLNDLLLYKEAIGFLSKSIEANPSNKEAYIERALAYFETNQIKLALQDYRMAKKLLMNSPFFPCRPFVTDYFPNNPDPKAHSELRDKSEYFKGFAVGATEGSKESIKEFVPSTLSSLTGMGNFLWSSLPEIDPLMGLTPAFAKASYHCVDECIKYFNTRSADEIIEDVIPEFKELVLKWGHVSDYDKGKMAGFTLGKYSLGILVCSRVATIAKRHLEFKRMNTLLTLEVCEASAANEVRILEEMARRTILRQNLFKDGKIKIHWDKQGKHMPSDRNFIPGRSTITASKKRIEELLEKHAGTGQPVGNKMPGMANYKERIDFSEIIGEFIEVREGKIITKALTTKGIIIYDGEGFIHVFPARP